MGKSDKKPLTPVERLQALSLVTRITNELSEKFGLKDKTLSEFVISLAEAELKAHLKANGAHTTSVPIEVAQSLRKKLTENGAAQVPLSVVSQVLQLVQSQSPKIARYRTTLEKKQKKKLIKSDGGNKDGDDTDGKGRLFSGSEAKERKAELGTSFPGLARQNLKGAVPLEDGFFEHSSGDVEKNKKEQTQAQRRGVSNLPAWMTK